MSSTTDIRAKAQDISNKAADVKTKVDDSVVAGQQKMNQSLDNVQNQLALYGDQIRKYLNGMQAGIEGYRFAVEKIENGLTVDVLFKATIKGKEGTSFL